MVAGKAKYGPPFSVGSLDLDCNCMGWEVRQTVKKMSFWKDERGSAYIELLWAIPVIVFLIVGGIAIGQLIVKQLNLLHSERETLRQTAIAGYYDYKAQRTLTQSLHEFGIDPGQVNVQATPYRQSFGNPVSVRLSMNLRLQMFGTSTPIVIPVHAEGTMASQYIPPTPRSGP